MGLTKVHKQCWTVWHWKPINPVNWTSRLSNWEIRCTYTGKAPAWQIGRNTCAYCATSAKSCCEFMQVLIRLYVFHCETCWLPPNMANQNAWFFNTEKAHSVLTPESSNGDIGSRCPIVFPGIIFQEEELGIGQRGNRSKGPDLLFSWLVSSHQRKAQGGQHLADKNLDFKEGEIQSSCSSSDPNTGV